MSIINNIRNHFASVNTEGKTNKQIACEYGKKAVVDSGIVAGAAYTMDFAEGMSIGARSYDKQTRAAVDGMANTLYTGAAFVGTVGLVHGTYCSVKAATAALNYSCDLSELD